MTTPKSDLVEKTKIPEYIEHLLQCYLGDESNNTLKLDYKKWCELEYKTVRLALSSMKNKDFKKKGERHSFKLCGERSDLCIPWGCKCKCHKTAPDITNMKLTLWDKVLLYFHYCPCGGKIFCWSWGKYKCNKCTRTYYG